MFWRSTAILFSDYELIIHILAFSSSAAGIISFSGYEFIIHVLALNSSTTLILFSCKFIILFPVHVPISVSGCTVTLQDVQLQCELQCKMYSYSVSYTARCTVTVWVTLQDVHLQCELQCKMYSYSVRWMVAMWDVLLPCDSARCTLCKMHCYTMRCTVALWQCET